jgi:DNA-3-methyladenine glycosylase
VSIPSVLPRSFYQENTLDVARKLLGKLVLRRIGNCIVGGPIVEVEAYKGKEDAASHAFRGMTQRNAVMFGEPGRAYVYFTYGMYYCLNFVTEPEGQPGAVLIRALEPMFGIPIMMENRKVTSIYDLTSGPGKLTKALGIDLTFNGVDLTNRAKLFVADGLKEGNGGAFAIERSTRVGVRSAKDKEWRFYVKGSPFLSQRR